MPSHHSYYWRELIDLLSTNEDITEIDVIFSKANRNEFLTTLRNKVREIEEQQRNSPTGSIDRVDFHIDYNEINDLLVHGIYLNQYMTKSSTETVTLNDPDDFLDGLFDICMLDNKLSNKLMILKVIHSIYKQNSRVSRLSRHIKYLIWLLSEQSMDRYIDIQYVTLEIFQTLFKDTSDANFPLYVDEKCFKSIMHIYTTILHRAYTKNMQAHQQVLTSTSFNVSNYNSKVISVLSTFILHQSTNLNESTSSDSSSISDSQRDPISVDLGHRARHNLSLTRSLPEEKEEAYSASIAKSIFNMNSDDLFSLYSIKAPTVDCIDFLELILDVISKSIIYSNTYKFIIQTDYMSLLLQVCLFLLFAIHRPSSIPSTLPSVTAPSPSSTLLFPPMRVNAASSIRAESLRSSFTTLSLTRMECPRLSLILLISFISFKTSNFIVQFCQAVSFRLFILRMKSNLIRSSSLMTKFVI